jgi:hypothetical protein
MVDQLITSKSAAESLGINVLTLYDWLSQSDAGTFKLRGESVTIEYYQGGARGQGRIRMSLAEVQRLLSLMRVTSGSRPVPTRRQVKMKRTLQHITTRPGRPDE